MKVTARRTKGSPSGPLKTFFAAALGKTTANASASATAVLTPRDIAFVLDLSASHNDDSSLRSYKNTEIANRDVWQDLWDERLASRSAVSRPSNEGYPGGPQFGNMNTWGTATTGPGWDFKNDSGLVRLPKGSDWDLSKNFVNQTVTAMGFDAYDANEIAVINSEPSSYEQGDNSTTYYRRRVRVALGLDRWVSSSDSGSGNGNGNNKNNKKLMIHQSRNASLRPTLIRFNRLLNIFMTTFVLLSHEKGWLPWLIFIQIHSAGFLNYIRENRFQTTSMN